MADVAVLIDTRSDSTEQFLVTVHTRHADLHNGYSRVRFQGLIQANKSTRVPIEFYVSRIGYGVAAYHPDYLLESAVTRERGEELPTLLPRRWDKILGGLTSLPLNGPEPTYAGIVGHVEYYRDQYLPALDRASFAPDAAVVSRLAKLLEKADALTTFSAPSTAGHSYEAGLKARRGQVLPDIEKLLAATRSRRLALQEFRAVTIGPKRTVEALLKEPEYGSLLSFVAGAREETPAIRLPRQQSWQNAATGLQFSYQIKEWYRRGAAGAALDCARGQLTFDGRSIVEGLSGDLVKNVPLEFCRQGDGTWDIAGRFGR